jgi:hypothetical protein
MESLIETPSVPTAEPIDRLLLMKEAAARYTFNALDLTTEEKNFLEYHPRKAGKAAADFLHLAAALPKWLEKKGANLKRFPRQLFLDFVWDMEAVRKRVRDAGLTKRGILAHEREDAYANTNGEWLVFRETVLQKTFDGIKRHARSENFRLMEHEPYELTVLEGGNYGLLTLEEAQEFDFEKQQERVRGVNRTFTKRALQRRTAAGSDLSFTGISLQFAKQTNQALEEHVLTPMLTPAPPMAALPPAPEEKVEMVEESPAPTAPKRGWLTSWLRKERAA